MGELILPSVRSGSPDFDIRVLSLLFLVLLICEACLGQVPEPAGLALMPVAPIGELFGWLFALELPNSQAGFKITGFVFNYVVLYMLNLSTHLSVC